MKVTIPETAITKSVSTKSHSFLCERLALFLFNRLNFSNVFIFSNCLKGYCIQNLVRRKHPLLIVVRAYSCLLDNSFYLVLSVIV